MIPVRLQPAIVEWRRNRRLRLGALAIVAILGMQLVLVLSDARARRVETYEREAALLQRLEDASREAAWPSRAAAAEAELAKLSGSIPPASSEGLAQAELQAWLGDFAVFVGIGEPVVRVEGALAVDGHPELWQVLARADGKIVEGSLPLLMRTLAEAQPWFQTERLEVQTGVNPRISMVMRAYFRRSTDKQAADQRPARLPSADAARQAGVPVAPVARNPLARNPLAPRNTGRKANSSRDAEAARPRRNPLAPPNAKPRPARNGPEHRRPSGTRPPHPFQPRKRGQE